MQQPFCAMSKRCYLCLPLALCIARSRMAKRPKAPFQGERSWQIDLTCGLLMRWCQHGLCLELHGSAWTNGVKHIESKEYSTEFLDSDRVSWVCVAGCHKEVTSLFLIYFSITFLMFGCFLYFGWFLYGRNRATPVITWILKCCQIETWVNYVYGFYLGVWFHPSKTKCGQHCLKGWHLLDLLEEHALQVGTSSVRIPNAKFWYGLPRWQEVFGFQF